MLIGWDWPGYLYHGQVEGTQVPAGVGLVHIGSRVTVQLPVTCHGTGVVRYGCFRNGVIPETSQMKQKRSTGTVPGRVPACSSP